MVKTKRLKHPYLWFQSVCNSSACNCGGAVCIIGKTHEAPRQLFRVLVYSLSYFIVAGFLLEIGRVPLFRYTNFHISLLSSLLIYGYTTSSQRAHLPVGLIAQLVEYCASIAEVVVSDPVQA